MFSWRIIPYGRISFYAPLVFYVSDDLVCWNVSPTSEVWPSDPRITRRQDIIVTLYAFIHWGLHVLSSDKESSLSSSSLCRHSFNLVEGKYFSTINFVHLPFFWSCWSGKDKDKDNKLLQRVCAFDSLSFSYGWSGKTKTKKNTKTNNLFNLLFFHLVDLGNAKLHSRGCLDGVADY